MVSRISGMSASLFTRLSLGGQSLSYAWLIHPLTYRRNNHDNIHVRGYKEEGTITTPFDMTVLNELDRFHLVNHAVCLLPQSGARGTDLQHRLSEKLVEHRQYITTHGKDLPEVRNWKWGVPG
jgi:xylulose-5-phosphate/fructose-6-phosphate phosphoketolase